MRPSPHFPTSFRTDSSPVRQCPSHAFEGIAPDEQGSDCLRTSPGRSGKAALVFVLSLAALVALTGWVVTRSRALEAADKSYARGDLVSALRSSLDHLERMPWSRDAALLAARCLSRLDYPDEAEAYFRRGSMARRLSLEDLQIRAYGFVRGNRRERAILAYEQILERDPRNVNALRLLAGVQMTQNNDPEVLKIADRLIQISEGAAIGYTLRGVVQHDNKLREEAVEAFARVLELDPELRVMPLPRRLFWTQFTDDLLKLGRTADVRRHMTQVLSQDPDPHLMNALGQAYYLEGNDEESERCFVRAAELDPKDFASRVNLGRLELHRGRSERALEHLEEAVKLGPRQYDAIYTLAMAYRQTGRIEDADRLEKNLEKIRGLAPPPASIPKGPLPRYAL